LVDLAIGVRHEAFDFQFPHPLESVGQTLCFEQLSVWRALSSTLAQPSGTADCAAMISASFFSARSGDVALLRFLFCAVRMRR